MIDQHDLSREVVPGDPVTPGAIDADPAGRVRCAELHLARGQRAEALRVAEEALAAGLEGPARSRAALVAGRALMATGREADGRRYLGEEAERAAGTDPASAAVMWAHVAGSALRGGLLDQARECAERGLQTAPSDSLRARALCRLALGAALIAAGRTVQGREVVPPTADLLEWTDPEMDGVFVGLTGGFAAIWSERYDDGLVILDALDRHARYSRSPGSLPAILTPRALLEYRLCRWSASAAAASEALEMSRRTGHTTIVPLITAILATVEAVQGRAAECRQRSLGLLDSPAADHPLIRTAALSALGLLELGEGRFEAAAHWFEMLSGGLPAPGRPHPAINMWEADLAEAYIGLGRAEQAGRVLERLEARALASDNKRSWAAVMRNRAVLHPDDGEAEMLFTQVLSFYEGPRWRFARARTQMARGERLLDAGRLDAAAGALRPALDAFDELGARGWAARAARALERSGGLRSGRQPAGPALTPVELRVSMAAAMGAGLADIAAGLFLDEAVTGTHLDAAMAKLGVDRPDDLAPLVGQLAHAGSLQARRCDAEPIEAVEPDLAVPAGATPVSIRLLGGFAVTDGRGPADLADGISARAVKVVALAGKVPAEELIEELWPETVPDLGRTRLRSLLARLRRHCRPVLARQGSWVVLADDVIVDVDVFERHAQEAQAAASVGSAAAGELARAAMALYGGELLPTDRHLDFTVAARERLRRRYLALAGVAIDEACEQQKPETAVRLLEDAIATDAYDEHLYIRAASILADAGRSNEARSMLRRGEAALAELGFTLPPAAEEIRRRL